MRVTELEPFTVVDFSPDRLPLPDVAALEEEEEEAAAVGFRPSRLARCCSKASSKLEGAFARSGMSPLSIPKRCGRRKSMERANGGGRRLVVVGGDWSRGNTEEAHVLWR